MHVTNFEIVYLLVISVITYYNGGAQSCYDFIE